MIFYRAATAADPCRSCGEHGTQVWLDTVTFQCTTCRNRVEKALAMPEETLIPHEFFPLDLETTGLDPASDVILEWAVCLAADDRAGDMSPVREFHSPISTTTFQNIGTEARYANALKAMDPYVLNMHTQNGLLEACAAETVTIAEADEFLVGLAVELGAKKRGLTLLGNSVHFDLAFIRVHLPGFAEYCSHRVFDVSTLMRAESTYGSGSLRLEPAHRALADVHQSIAAVAAWRKARGL